MNLNYELKGYIDYKKININTFPNIIVRDECLDYDKNYLAFSINFKNYNETINFVNTGLVFNNCCRLIISCDINVGISYYDTILSKFENLYTIEEQEILKTYRNEKIEKNKNIKFVEHYIILITKKKKVLQYSLSILDQYNIIGNKGKRKQLQKKNDDATFMDNIVQSKKIVEETMQNIRCFSCTNVNIDKLDNEISSIWDVTNKIDTNNIIFVITKNNQENIKYLNDIYKNIIIKKKKISKIPVYYVFNLIVNGLDKTIHLSESNSVLWLETTTHTLSR